MKLPESVILLGESPIAKSITQILRLLGVQECHSYSRIPENREENEHNDRYALEEQLKDSYLVIAISLKSITNSTDLIIHNIHKLRTDWEWVGGFLAIVDNDKLKNKLEKSSLFGDSYGLLYKQVAGHSVTNLNQSQFLTDLFITIDKMEEMFRNRWKDLLSTSWKLPQEVQKIEKWVNQKELEEANSQAHQVLKIFKDQDWNLLLPKHKDMRLVISFKDKYCGDNNFSLETCLEIAKEIQKIISKSIMNNSS